MRLFYCSVALMLALVVIPDYAFAATFINGNQSGIQAEQIINDDVYIAASNVQSQATVVGDVVAAGGNVSITGSTSQSVLAVGGTVDVAGNVGDDIRAAGGTITVTGQVVGDVILAGGHVMIREGSIIGRDAVVTGGSVTIDGAVHGNVQVNTSQLTVGPHAVITGSLTYNSPHQATIQNGAQLNGGVQFHQIEHKNTHRYFDFGSALIRFLSLFVIALLLQWLFKPWILATAFAAHRGVWGNLGRGFVALIIIPILAMILFITIIGIPIGIILLLGYIILLITSYLFLPIIAGAWVLAYFRKTDTPYVDWKSALLGAAIIAIISIIPFVGGLINCILLLIILGTLLDGMRSITRRGQIIQPAT